MFVVKKREISIFCLFVLLTLVFTYPLISNLNDSIFSDKDWSFDSLASLYIIWQLKYNWINNLPLEFNDLVAFPFGVDNSQGVSQCFFSYPLLFLALWKNEIFAHNIYILSSFVLTAIFTYYLVFYLTKNRYSAFISGVIFSFCPNHFLQSFSHLSMAAIQWIPLYILALFKFSEHRSYKNALFWVLTFSLVALWNYYYGYFMVIITIAYLTFNIGYELFIDKLSIAKAVILVKQIFVKDLKIYIVAGVLMLVIVGAFSYQTVINMMKYSESESAVSLGYQRSYDDLFKYAARMYDYILPSEYHPIFGRVAKKIVENITGGQRHWAERTLYIGFVPVVLVAVGIIGWWKRCKLKTISDRERFIVPPIVFLAIIAFYCSLAPVIYLWRIKIPTPSFLLYKIFPMFRVYARMGFVFMLFISVLAGFGVRDVIQKCKLKQTRFIIVSLIFSLIIFEYTVIPPFRNMDLSAIPSEYKWLAGLDKNIVVAEYPMHDTVSEKHSKYLFYQRFHEKKLINGAREGTIADEVRKKINDVSDTELPKLLSSLETDYMVVHTNKYDFSELQQIDKMLGISLVKEFDKAKIYKIVAKPAKIIQILMNFYPSEILDNRGKWQWMNNNGKIWILNSSDQDIGASIKTKAISFYRSRFLKIYLNGNLVKTIEISSIQGRNDPIAIILDDLRLFSGGNIIKFNVPDGADKIDDIIHNGDMRKVSVAFSNLTVEYKD